MNVQQQLLPLTTTPADANLSKDSLLLPLTGLAGGTTFTDLSPSPKTITVHGGAQTVTSQQGYAAGSCLSLAVGTPDWLDAANSTDFAFGNGDFTIEFFTRLRSLPGAGGAYTFAAKRATNAVFAPFQTYVLPSGAPGALLSSTGSSWDISLSGPASNMGIAQPFVHFVLMRSGSTFALGTNGAIVAKTTSSATLMTNTANLSIGAAAMDGTFSVDGWMNHLRITKGLCRYSTAGAVGASYGQIPATPFVPFPNF